MGDLSSFIDSYHSWAAISPIQQSPLLHPFAVTDDDTRHLSAERSSGNGDAGADSRATMGCLHGIV